MRVLDAPVLFTGDGPGDSPESVSRRLAEAVESGTVEPDVYGEGGVVADLEARMAELFGKPAGLVMPTGTLANVLAVRSLAGDRTRVLVQADSHLARDCGDAPAQLAGLTPIPLPGDGVRFGVEEVESAIERAADGKVRTGVGAISIESPVRRAHGATIDAGSLSDIARTARAAGIGSHLDGARALVSCAYDGRTPAEVAAPFDTAMTSLWKLFGVPHGALLVGDADRLAQLREERRRFGGALRGFWLAARLVIDRLDGCVDRLRAARDASERVLTAVEDVPGVRVERVVGGTNVFALRFDSVEPGAARERARAAGVRLPSEATADGALWCSVNETWMRRSVDEIVGAVEVAARPG